MGFRVEGLGFEGLGFRVWGLGFGCPYVKDYSIVGSVLGSVYVRKLPFGKRSFGTRLSALCAVSAFEPRDIYDSPLK